MPNSRLSSQFADTLKHELQSRKFKPGELLPGQRILAKEHHLSEKTVRRALKMLTFEGLIAPEDRRGYRVLGQANDPERGFPFACVISKPQQDTVSWFVRRLMNELQAAAGRRGWSLLTIQRESRTSDEIVAHLKAARVCGVIVDSLDRELIDAISKMGVPVVLGDAWREDIALDAVAQDGFTGAMLAAMHLTARGCKRLGFVGPPLLGASPQVIERLAGAVGGAVRSGSTLPAEFCLEVPWGDFSTTVARARKLLSRANRPDGIIAPWTTMGVAVVKAAAELGLEVGREIEVVGWSPEEDYDLEYAAKFQPGKVPPAVVWSMAELSEMCILRLMQRRSSPQLPVSFTRVSMRMRMTGNP